jgi:hypothetical protein
MASSAQCDCKSEPSHAELDEAYSKTDHDTPHIIKL